MACNKKTKLLKMVCKQAQLMRDPFRNSSSISKAAQLNKKPLSLNKTGEKFRSKLVALSLEKTWSLVQKVCIDKK